MKTRIYLIYAAPAVKGLTLKVLIASKAITQLFLENFNKKWTLNLPFVLI